MRDRLGSVGTETNVVHLSSGHWRDDSCDPRAASADARFRVEGLGLHPRRPSPFQIHDAVAAEKAEYSYCAMAYVLATIGNGVDAGYRFPTD